MRELYFTSTYKRSLRTIRLEYGQLKKMFVLRTIEGEINGRGETEGSPREEIFEDQQGLLTKVYEIKSGLLEGITSSTEKNNMSMLLENQAKQLVNEANTTGTGANMQAGNS